ncbi:MAG: FHA domain-containing protein [Chloracidobacterium sp.]|nr:FHA domain-containing protein [Chloracidobacterium sp.]
MAEIRLSRGIGHLVMAQKIRAKKQKPTPDWLVQGVLTKLGDTFDRLTGRGWKPSSSLATSELAERLKALVDAEVREEPGKRFYIPHNIKLKVQWDKFSTDSDDSLKPLQNELLAALIDHINDRRYHTYAPISLEVKADYFTNGVKLFASFEDKGEDEREVALDVTVPDLNVADLIPKTAGSSPEAFGCEVTISFEAAGKQVVKSFNVEQGQRLSIGRTGENDVLIDDHSISKAHAALLLNKEGSLMLADTGSTNGTFIDGERIAYGKAYPINPGQMVKLGSVNIAIDRSEIEFVTSPEPETAVEDTGEDVVKIGEFEFSSRKPPEQDVFPEPNATLPSIGTPGDSVFLRPLPMETAGSEADNLTVESFNERANEK